jgi:hypothetical protein
VQRRFGARVLSSDDTEVWLDKIGVSTYQIVSTLPQELKDQLPAPEQIARLLQGME